MQFPSMRGDTSKFTVFDKAKIKHDVEKLDLSPEVTDRLTIAWLQTKADMMVALEQKKI